MESVLRRLKKFLIVIVEISKMENVLNVPLDFISMEKEFAQKYQMNVRYLMRKNKNVQNATMAMNLMKKIFVLRKKMM